MDTKMAIRQFYEETIRKAAEQYGIEPILGSVNDKFRIGCAGFDPEDTLQFLADQSRNTYEIALAALIEEVPTNVLRAFERHIWYAQHSVNSISVFKIPVEEVTTFAICLQGYVDDGWDNSGEFIEVYNQQGQLVGSARVPSCDGQEYWRNWEWNDRPLRGDDFYTPAPPWSEEEANERGMGKRKQISYDNQRRHSLKCDSKNIRCQLSVFKWHNLSGKFTPKNYRRRPEKHFS